MLEMLPAMLAANVPPTYTVAINRAELNALLRVLSTQVQRPVYEPDRQIRGETAAIEAFLDRAVVAVQAQNEGERHADNVQG